jgi:hypothetical protein
MERIHIERCSFIKKNLLACIHTMLQQAFSTPIISMQCYYVSLCISSSSSFEVETSGSRYEGIEMKKIDSA